jgi:hypothetical protein
MRFLSRPKRRDGKTKVGNLRFDDLGRIVQNLGQKWRKQLKLKKPLNFLRGFLFMPVRQFQNSEEFVVALCL